MKRRKTEDSRFSVSHERSEQGGDQKDPPPWKQILVGLKQIIRLLRMFDDLMTEPLTRTELASYFDCCPNAVTNMLLPRYSYERVGRRYRMPVKVMPPRYLMKVLLKACREVAPDLLVCDDCECVEAPSDQSRSGED